MRTQYLIQRILLVIPTLFLILVGIFLMLYIAPGDPVELLVDMEVEYVPEEVLDKIRKDLGLDQPLHIQFIQYVNRILHGDLGTSFRNNLPVAQIIASSIKPTIYLAIAGLCIAFLIGLPAGIISAYRPNTLIDYLVLTFSITGLSAPNFWIGILFIYFFAYKLPLFPIMGMGEDNLLSTLYHLVMPACAIGWRSAGLLARLTRSAMLEVLGQDYVRTAHAKGLRKRKVLVVHVLRNAAIPIIATSGTMFAFMLTGSVVIETVFSRTGLGFLIFQGIYNRDFPVVRGLVLLFGVTIIAVNLLADILIGLIDPRVSYD